MVCDHVIDSHWAHPLNGMMHPMHWHMECWVNTFLMGLSVSPWRLCGQSLFCHGKDHITSISFIVLSIYLCFKHFISINCLQLVSLLFSLIFIPMFHVKYLQPLLVAITHFSLLAVLPALIVSVRQRRCCLWTDDLIDFVLHWAKWQWWTDGWGESLWFQPEMSHAKPENC